MVNDARCIFGLYSGVCLKLWYSTISAYLSPAILRFHMNCELECTTVSCTVQFYSQNGQQPSLCLRQTNFKSEKKDGT